MKKKDSAKSMMLKLSRTILFQNENYSLTYPISNTRARNMCFLFSNTDCEKGVDVFIGGCNDVNHILKTIFSKSMESRISFHLNEVEDYILARVFLTLVLFLVEKDVDFIYQVRCSQFLTPEHHKKLLQYLKLIVDNLEIDSNESTSQETIFAFTKKGFLKERFCFDTKESLDRILRVFKFWLLEFKLNEKEAQSIRDKFMLDYVKRVFRNNNVTMDNAYNGLVNMVMRGLGKSIKSSIVKGYITSGIFLTENRKREDHTLPNPTYFTLNKTGICYSTHPTSNPFESFDETKNGGRAQIQQFRLLVQKFRQNKVTKFCFTLTDILRTLRTSEKRFDFINTSNLADNLEALNILLCGRNALKDEQSVLEIESMKMIANTNVKNAYQFYRILIPFSPTYLPLYFDLMCLSNVYIDQPKTTYTSQRRSILISNSQSRLYFRKMSFSSLSPFSSDNSSKYCYDFDFVKNGVGVILKELFHFLHIILKFNGVGNSHQQFRQNTGRLHPLAPNLTLQSFFLVLKNLHLHRSSLETIFDVLRLESSVRTRSGLLGWEEIFKLCNFFRPKEIFKMDELAKLLPIYQMELEVLICLYFPDFRKKKEDEDDQVRLFKLPFRIDERYLMYSRTPGLSLGFINTKQKLSALEFREEERIVIFPLLQSHHRKLKEEGEQCVLVQDLKTGENMFNLFGWTVEDKVQFERYSHPMEFGDAEMLEISPQSLPSSEATVEDNNVNWKITKKEYLVKIHVGKELIENEIPSFEVEGKNNIVNVKFPKHGKTFSVPFDVGVIHEIGGGRFNVRYQRSKKRNVVIIRVDRTATRKNNKINFDTLCSNFSKRLLRSNQIMYQTLKEWNHNRNEEVQGQLSRSMFTTEELFRLEQGNGTPMNSDHAHRIKLLYVVTRLLRGMGTVRLFIQDSERSCGLAICCCSARTGRNGLPVFEIVYRQDKKGEVDQVGLGRFFSQTKSIAERLEEEVRKRFGEAVQKGMELAMKVPGRVFVDSKGVSNIEATEEEQDYFVNFLEENSMLYGFEDKSVMEELGLGRRSVVVPLLPKKKGMWELLTEEKRVEEMYKHLQQTMMKKSGGKQKQQQQQQVHGRKKKVNSKKKKNEMKGKKKKKTQPKKKVKEDDFADLDLGLD